MTSTHLNDSVFHSANIKNIETLASLTAKYARSLIGVNEEPRSFELSTATTSRCPLSSDQELEQLRAEVDYIDTQLNQHLQYMEILRQALESVRQSRLQHANRRKVIVERLEGIMETRTAKLPGLPGEILSKICEEYTHIKKMHGEKDPKPTSCELCDIICTGQHVPLKVQVGAMSPQSFRDSILQNRKAPLDVFTSSAFSTSESRHSGSRTLRTLENALEFGDRWRTLSIEEDNMDAVDFVLRHCWSILPRIRILDISGKFVDESMERNHLPSFISWASHIPRLRVAKVPLGYIASSKWLFQHLTSLCLGLPDKSDKPDDLVDCLQSLAGLRRLTLRASGKFHLESYRTETIASMPSLEELELMFDELDTDILTCMLRSFSCQNVRKYIAHFITLFEYHSASTRGETQGETQEEPSGDFAVNLWSFLDEKFPALEVLTLGNHIVTRHRGHALYSTSRDSTSWEADFLAILAKPVDAGGRWLLSRLSSLTIPVGVYECLLFDPILRLVAARTQHENISNVQSVTMYDLSGSDLVEATLDSLRFHIPNLHIERSYTRRAEGFLFA
ncbi:hypothetical protein BD410DRAFT_901755 [Rickenella mellea]|uniref:Uncharacterized protein n=1 Tax=Rickenella mellea TaxID=50990 RepID=A0A4Y7PQS7_9AGAM|nr:hypothetical protein BD410DRAFT_901755 [Rickenella mellea]